VKFGQQRQHGWLNPPLMFMSSKVQIQLPVAPEEKNRKRKKLKIKKNLASKGWEANP